MLSDSNWNCILSYEMKYKNTVATYQRGQINSFIKVDAVTHKSHAHNKHGTTVAACNAMHLLYISIEMGLYEKCPSSYLHLITFNAMLQNIHKWRKKNEKKPKYVSTVSIKYAQFAHMSWQFSVGISLYVYLVSFHMHNFLIKMKTTSHHVHCTGLLVRIVYRTGGQIQRLSKFNMLKRRQTWDHCLSQSQRHWFTRQKRISKHIMPVCSTSKANFSFVLNLKVISDC